MYVLRFIFLSMFVFFFQINTNGAITTGFFPYGNPSLLFPGLEDYSIYPFYFDTNTEATTCGADCDLFYRINPNQETLNNISKLVNKKYEIDETPGFTPLREETTIITWSKVPNYLIGPEVGKITHQKTGKLFGIFYFRNFVKAK